MSGFGLLYKICFCADEEEKQIWHTLSHRSFANDAFLMNDREFVKTYRLSKSLVRKLFTELKPYLPKERRSTSLGVAVKVLITLAFYASGSYQSLVGQNISHNVSQSSVSRAVRQVTKALNQPGILGKYVFFPRTRQAREQIQSGFYSKFGFPGVVGCIDGTHVSIRKPSEDEKGFHCRKGYHSLNVMIICDADQNILCVDSLSPSSLQNSTIWRDHTLNNYLNKVVEDGENIFLLGDSKYTLRKNIITPILNAEEGSPENLFYRKHVQTWNVVEQTIEDLKARFRCLLVARPLHYKPEVAGEIVNACCVLHNMANRAQVPAPVLPDQDRDEEQRLQVLYNEEPMTDAATIDTSTTTDDTAHRDNSDLADGLAVQQQVVNILWALRNKS